MNLQKDLDSTIKKALGRIGVAEVALDPYRLNLQAMMKRRHLIVHRADRNEMRGSGHHVARTLSTATVEVWRDAVRDFGAAVLAEL